MQDRPGLLLFVAKEQEPEASFETRPTPFSDGAQAAEHECAEWHRDKRVPLQFNGRDAMRILGVGVVAGKRKRHPDKDLQFVDLAPWAV